MNEPIKELNHKNPESYSPKIPKLLDMLEDYCKPASVSELREWCNIGGYDLNNILYVNAFPDDLPVDENGYCTVKDGLKNRMGFTSKLKNCIRHQYRKYAAKRFNQYPLLFRYRRTTMFRLDRKPIMIGLKDY